jgi:hypothetical protein
MWALECERNLRLRRDVSQVDRRNGARGSCELHHEREQQDPDELKSPQHRTSISTSRGDALFVYSPYGVRLRSSVPTEGTQLTYQRVRDASA